MPQAFEHAAGDVRAARVLHGVVVGERNLFQHRAVLGPVERRPSAVVVLHRQQPVDAALTAADARCTAQALQRHGHHRGVIHVGVMRIVKLEVPPRRLDAGAVLLPVGCDPAFLRQQPLRRRRAASDSGDSPASASACNAIPVSQTGEMAGLNADLVRLAG